MTIPIFDPATADSAYWPGGHGGGHDYIRQMAHTGIAPLIGNVRARWMALRSADHVFPVTVNDGEVGDSYVSLPHSAYILYGREEMAMVNAGPVARLASPALGMIGALLRTAGINRIVQLDNWLLSTCLHGDWHGDDLPAIRAALCQAYPGHMIGLRSLDPWSCPALLEAARADSWTLLPSRQIWVTDDPAQQLACRHNLKEDRRMLRRSGWSVEQVTALSKADGVRIAALYHQLYIAKYSRLNPWFTAAFVQMSQHTGMIAYHVVRDDTGVIVAFAGIVSRGGIVTCPILGYCMERPQREGLYRIASLLILQAGMEQGARVHGSAGAGAFKRGRGARGVIEYCALYTGHLGQAQRRTITTFAAALERFVVPRLVREGL